MKKLHLYIVVLSTFLINTVQAQMIIADDENLPITTESTLLQFEDGQTRGIILPANSTIPTNPTNGTFILDLNDSKIKMYQNKIWIELTDRGRNPTNDTNSEDIGDGVIIGDETSTATGVVVFEAKDKAIVLPRVQNVTTDIISPYPGMICYDIASQTVAIFDGVSWNFWS